MKLRLDVEEKRWLACWVIWPCLNAISQSTLCKSAYFCNLWHWLCHPHPHPTPWRPPLSVCPICKSLEFPMHACSEQIYEILHINELLEWHSCVTQMNSFLCFWSPDCEQSKCNTLRAPLSTMSYCPRAFCPFVINGRVQLSSGYHRNDTVAFPCSLALFHFQALMTEDCKIAQIAYITDSSHFSFSCLLFTLIFFFFLLFWASFYLFWFDASMRITRIESWTCRKINPLYLICMSLAKMGIFYTKSCEVTCDPYNQASFHYTPGPEQQPKIWADGAFFFFFWPHKAFNQLRSPPCIEHLSAAAGVSVESELLWSQFPTSSCSQAKQSIDPVCHFHSLMSGGWWGSLVCHICSVRGWMIRHLW